MKRRNLPEFKSLVDLLDENTPAKSLSREQKLKAHLKNLLKISSPGPEGRVGSGYMLTSDGYFITNHHVLPNDSANVFINEVLFSFPLQKVLLRSRVHDLALAKISLDYSHPPSVVLANQYAGSGEKIRTYSFNTTRALRSHGAILNINFSGIPPDFHKLTSDLKIKMFQDTQYTNCTIKLGWSGGPVVSDVTGDLVGITTFGFFPQGTDQRNKYHAFSSAVIVRKMIDYFLDGQAK